jgi:hypothetical protein
VSRVSEELANITIADVAVTAATSSTPFGFSEAQANSIPAQINAILLALEKAGVLIP